MHIALLSILVAILSFCGFFWVSSTPGVDIKDINTGIKEGEHNLPWFPPPFIGRDENVSHITQWLLYNSSVRGVHITGAPAIGKSHLAVNVGYKLVGQGVNIKYINVYEKELLDDSNKPTVQESPVFGNEMDQGSTAMVKKGKTELAFSWTSSNEKEEDVVISVSGLIKWARRLTSTTVIILDNCDSLMEPDEKQKDKFIHFLHNLHEASRHIKIMSTSRIKITLVGVKHFAMSTLDENSSISLLQYVCEHFTVKEAKKVAEFVGHNPLGLKLAASLAFDIITVKELIEELENNSVAALSGMTIPADTKMQSIIKTSFNHLENEIVLCAKNISLFPGSFSKEAGRSILSKVNVTDAMHCLNTLSLKSILEWYMIRGESRYRYHQLVKDFLKLENLTTTTPVTHFFDMYVAYYTSSIQSALKDCEIAVSEDCRTPFRCEDHNFRYALKFNDFCSIKEKVIAVIKWGNILISPILYRIYSQETLSELLNEILWMILDLSDNHCLGGYKDCRSEDLNHFDTQQLDDAFNKLSTQLMEWKRGNFIEPRTTTVFSNLIPSFIMQTQVEQATEHSYEIKLERVDENNRTEIMAINLCIAKCKDYCSYNRTSKVNATATTTFYICCIGCDKDCCYYLVNIFYVALLTTIAMPLMKKGLYDRLEHHNWINNLQVQVLAFLTSMMMSSGFMLSMSTWLFQLYLTAFSQIVPYIYVSNQSLEFLPTAPDDPLSILNALWLSRHVITTYAILFLLGVIGPLFWVITCKCFETQLSEAGGQFSVLLYYCCLILLYFFSDHIVFTFSMRLIVALYHFYFVGVKERNIGLLYIILCFFGREPMITPCQYVAGSHLWDIKNCAYKMYI